MNQQDNPILREILDRAAELQPAQRSAFLDRSCAGDQEMRAEIESLLACLDQADEFLCQPTVVPGALPSDGSDPGGNPPHSDGAGSRIENYKLLELIGEGGFGSVFMAEQERPVRRRVALKIIKPGMDSAAIIARFEAERQALAMMDHPNIARVLDAGATENGRPYFVMELVQGIPINQYCDRKRFTPRQRIELFVPVCRAVQHAHQKGIIHRDLKPSNILAMTCDGQPVPKVIDFGVAKALHQSLTDKTLFTQFGSAVGTLEYMSPEQAEIDVAAADTRSDIYSLGVLLYELLTGVTPLDRAAIREAGYAAMLRMIREQEPLKPSTRLTRFGEALASISAARGMDARELKRITAGDLDWIVMKCLEKDRSRRYETAGDLARDLERYLRDEPVEASPPSATVKLRRYMRKHRVGISVTSAFALLLLLATALSSWQAVRATHAYKIAFAQTLRADHQAELARLQTAEAERQRNNAESQKALVTREKIEAQRQQRIAAAVNQFLLNMLGSANPNKLRGDKITVVQLLTVAEKELDAGSRGTDPVIEAELRGTIGRTLQSLGHYEQAERNLRKAVAILRNVSPPANLELADSISDLGVFLAEQNNLQESEKLLRESLALYRGALPAEHPFVAGCLVNLGQLFSREGRLHEAESAYREALKIDRKAVPADSAGLRSSLSNLGLLLTDLNRLDESEQLLREALAIDRRSLPAGHPNIATDLNNLAYLLARRNDIAGAESMYREALAINRKLFPSGDPALSRNLSDLALLLMGNKPQEAEALYREALEMDRKLLPPDHPDIARKLNGLATLLSHHGRLKEAERMYREVLDIDRKSLPPDHPDIAIHRDNFTVFLLRQKRVADAQTLQRDALDHDRKVLPPGHNQIAIDLNNVAILLVRQNRFGEAEQVYRQLVKIDRERHASATALAMHLVAQARILERDGQPAKAEQPLREAASLCRLAHPAGNAFLIQTTTELGGLLLSMNRAADAEPVWREAMRLCTSTSKPDPLAIANASSGLGRSLLGQGKYDEAKPLLSSALATRDRALGPTSAASLRTASALAELLNRTGDHRAADRLRESHPTTSASIQPSVVTKSSPDPSVSSPAAPP